MSRVGPSNSGCTRVVGKVLYRLLQMLSAVPRASLNTLPLCSPNYPCTSRIRCTWTLRPFLKNHNYIVCVMIISCHGWHTHIKKQAWTSNKAMHYLYESHVQQTKPQQLNLGNDHGEVCMTKPQQTSTQHCAIEHWLDDIQMGLSHQSSNLFWMLPHTEVYRTCDFHCVSKVCPRNRRQECCSMELQAVDQNFWG